MPIPNPVIRDVEDVIGRGQGKRAWRARRMSALLRRKGYLPGAEWIEANVSTYEAEKETAIDPQGTN